MAPREKATLYDILRVSRTSEQGEIRRAFKRLALQVHPDKRPNDPHAAADFQALRHAYDVLSDPARRARYDRVGDADEDSAGFQDAYERYRGVRVTSEDVDACLARYRGSEEEARELAAFLVDRGGDVTDVLAFVPGSRDEDVPRFVQAWTEMLDAGRVPAPLRANFDKTKTRIRTLDELDNDEHDLEVGEEEDAGEGDEDDDDDDGFIAHSDEEAGEEMEEEEEDTAAAAAAAPRLGVNDRVQARWKRGSRWYDAVVVAESRSGAAVDVRYDDGAEEKGVPRELVRPSTKPLPAPKRRRGAAERKTEKSAERKTEPKSARGRGAAAQDDDGEVEDVDALRRALAAKGERREADFAAFEARWTRKSGGERGAAKRSR